MRGGTNRRKNLKSANLLHGIGRLMLSKRLWQGLPSKVRASIRDGGRKSKFPDLLSIIYMAMRDYGKHY
jgi:hypothetical protein